MVDIPILYLSSETKTYLFSIEIVVSRLRSVNAKQYFVISYQLRFHCKHTHTHTNIHTFFYLSIKTVDKVIRRF